jgi:hypothetical protein
VAGGRVSRNKLGLFAETGIGESERLKSGPTNHDFIEGSSQMKKVVTKVVTVEQLIGAVKSVQEEQRRVQLRLQDFLQVLDLRDTRAEIAVVRGTFSPGRVGKVCSVVSRSSKEKKAD